MPRALLCPKCKSYMPVPARMPRSGNTVNVACRRCGINVDAFIVELDKEPKTLRPGDADPTEQDEEVVRSISSLPILSALTSVGSHMRVLLFVLARLSIFFLLFFLTSTDFQVHLLNPYFLVIGSSLAVVIAHLLSLVNLPSPFDALWGIVRYIFGYLPVIAFEILLLMETTLLYVLVELALVAIAVIMINERYKKKSE